MFDYTYLYKEAWDGGAIWPEVEYDLFISAFNASERVQIVANKVQAARKISFISPEYDYQAQELTHAPGDLCAGIAAEEAESVAKLLNFANIDGSLLRLCVDTTGFMRHHLLILLRSLLLRGVRKFDALYAEPGQYLEKEATKFSDGEVRLVKQVPGFEGQHSTDTSKDLLIIGAGYDHSLISHAAEYKNSARKVQILGFPSLRADMYQENVLKVEKAGEQMGTRLDSIDTYFAPAHDPFVTANVLAKIVKEHSRLGPITNLYLCPLATKAFALGFGIFLLREFEGREASIILPYTKSYSRETSTGIGRVWRYAVEL